MPQGLGAGTRVGRNTVVKCRDCAFWELQEPAEADLGFCRFPAPSLTGWPVTQALEWCGHYSSSRRALYERTMTILKLLLGIVVFVAIIAISIARIAA